MRNFFNTRMVLATVFAGLAFCFWRQVIPAFTETTYSSPGTPTVATTLPWIQAQALPNTTYTIRTVLHSNLWTISKWRIMPDDCLRRLRLDGVDVPLDQISGSDLCDYSSGFVIDLSRYITKPVQEILLEVENRAGPTGLGIYPYFDGWVFAGGALCWLVALLLLSSSFKLLLSQRFILSVAMLIQLMFFAYNSPFMHDHDVWGHLDHIRLVAGGNIVPKTSQCFECNHPPLYYWFAALASGYQGGWSARSLCSLQLLSMMAMTGFKLMGARFLRTLLPPTLALSLATALLCFWPDTFLRGLGIGNDAWLYLMAMAAALSGLALQKKANITTVLVAIFTILLAVVTKLNGGLLCIPFAIITLTAVFRQQITVKQGLLAYSMLALSLLATLAALSLKGSFANADPGLTGWLHVENTWANYLTLDWHSFFTEAFTSPSDDRLGRQNFWNYLIKTAIFGEFTYQPRFQVITALLLGPLALITACLSVFGIYTALRRQLLASAPWVFLTLATLLSAVAYRFHYVAACANDARYVLFIGPFLGFFWAEFYTHGLARRPILQRFMAGSALAVVGLSAAFFVYPYFA